MIVKKFFTLLFFAAMTLPAFAQSNDLCGNATAITSCNGANVTANTTTATSTGVPSPACGGTDILTDPIGVWYTVTGIGGNITLSTDNPGTDYDTEISVYDGSCAALNCIAGDDDGGTGQTSLLTFSSVLGTTYYIYVDGNTNSTGNFELSVSCTAPPNDLCDNAITLSCSSANVSGNTQTASSTGLPSPACGGTDIITDPIGVWYTVAGTGLNITLSTANPGTDYDTEISVYDGSCAALNCIAGDDDGGGGLTSLLTFSSVLGTTYYIYVDGNTNATGNFELSISCESPANDLCDNAIVIGCGSANVTGNTLAATSTGVPSPACGGTDILTDPIGVWYTVAGTGLNITLSTANPGTDYDTEISVYDGSCAALNCIAGDDDGGGGLTSLLTFSSVLGTTYYIYVDGNTNATGNFELSISCESPPNDLCDNAIVIGCGSANVTGNTLAATSTGVPSPACGGTDIITDPIGVWYAVAGIGGDITLSTANPGTDYDTEISVYDGSCAALNCIAGDDDGGGGLTSLLTFSSVLGTTYYIYVDGNTNSTGNFELSISCVPGNDLCGNAYAIACGGANVIANTTFATSAGVPSPACGGTDILTDPIGVWYTITGTGENIILSTANPGTNYDTEISVFDGSCAALNCIAGDDDGGGGLTSMLTLSSVLGTTYFIYVDGNTNATGNFELSVSCCAAPGTACDDGDVCTTGDVEDGNCNCAGTFADADADGVCDANDLCPGIDDALIGTACDDGDVCTVGDVYDGNCICAGTFADADADGVCDANDLCAGSATGETVDANGCVPGCIDPNAHNYNMNAQVDDLSCITCSDGIQNGTETGVDCGGTNSSCPVCPTTCPDDYAAGGLVNSQPALTGSLDTNADFETPGAIVSDQIIGAVNPAIGVDYDSGTCIEMLPGFEVKTGVEFDAFIDPNNCNDGAGGNQ